MYQIKVNDKYNFDITADYNQLEVNNETIELDRLALNATATHVLYKNKSYTIEIVELNKEEKTAVIKVNNNTYNLTIKDQFDQLLKQLGMDNLAVNKIQQIKAPMPGLVLSVLATEGAEVKKGDNLLVLEAMKMENMIKSPTDGIIKKIEIKQGDKVEKNEILISFH
ncbi:acetyl-CoA carboxylase biotin carboxyl carrier protein subunit [Pedobacter boryungensis]|uniref:Acetyl-CoA carboxylase biotin carboxyl carrier protein subunit n=1 Tax=Pedobacter boryungensis TaxID=869962 RepID=A0ABX2DFW7_9SPHI|nr:acetyl-CoA carboxylase biotin carboxyl carrier protein subunit [Pedobacter boryungensis]NQX32820.1 acetyl-CoA carboxylase biotin carboxyl carrier protein subunit [Pedobacter boryungensis]